VLSWVSGQTIETALISYSHVWPVGAAERR